MENSINTITQGVCRCCLSSGNHRHLMKEYFFRGIREVYVEIITECLNLFLTTDERLTMLICSNCIKQLRMAYSFREKVAAAERQLLAEVDKETEFVNVTVEEPSDTNIKSENVDIVKVEEHNLHYSEGVPADGEIDRYTFDRYLTGWSVGGAARLPIRSLFTLLLKTPKLHRFRETNAGKEFPLLGSPHDKSESEALSADRGDVDHKDNERATAVKAETGPRRELSPDRCSDSDPTYEDLPDVKAERDDDIADILGEPLKAIKSKRKAAPRKRKTRDTINTNRKKYKIDDSTPLAHITKLSLQGKDKTVIKNDKTSKQYSTTYLSKQTSLKNNNDIRANIISILKNSTILPFRKRKSVYECFYCKESYVLFSELKKHTTTDHSDISELAIDKSMKSLQELVVTADISSIKCRLCSVESNTIDDLIEHLTKTHKRQYYDVGKPSHGILGFDLSSNSLKCHICNKGFPFFKTLSAHMNEHLGRFVCYVCGKKVLSEHRLKCHIYTHHQTNKDDQDNQPDRGSKCKHCGELFKTEGSLAYHIKKEHFKSIIKCPKCPRTFPFTKYDERRNHMAEVHNIEKPKFKCDTCGREYANTGSLAAHKRYIHKRAKELRCDICGYITVHNTVMKNHMDVHNGIKKYECEFCKKRFAKRYTLTLHLKIHLNDKRFVCVLCEAAFIQKNSLKNHLKARHPDSGIDISKL